MDGNHESDMSMKSNTASKKPIDKAFKKENGTSFNYCLRRDRLMLNYAESLAEQPLSRGDPPEKC